jgi:1,2-diacylglycerol-3-alpha-glucose alpha-1,2-galactosyltransferase
MNRNTGRPRVHIISESSFGPVGHGVHSSFSDHIDVLRDRSDLRLLVNGPPRWTPDVLHVHTLGPYAMAMVAMTRAKRVASAHVTASSLLGSIAGGGHLFGAIRQYVRWAYNRFDLVLAVSEETKNELRRLGVRTEIEVLANSVRVDDIRLAADARPSVRRQLGVLGDEPIVISVGQVQPRKGVREFFSFARTLPHTRFLWVGRVLFGPIASARREMFKLMRRAPDNVTFVGSVERAQVYGFLAAADIYVSASKHETFGLATMEAAAAGLPLVLSDIPVHRSLYGGFAQLAEISDMSSAIASLARDADVRRAWSKKATMLADRYDWKGQAEELVNIYRRLATG